MTPEKFKSLLAGYYAGTLSAKEKEELTALLHDPQHRGQLEQLFTEDLADPALKITVDTESLELMYQQIQLQKQIAPVRRISYGVRWVAAASVTLLLATGAWFLFFQPSHKPAIADTKNVLKNDIAAPAYTKAVLLLADGKEVILDSAANKQLTVQGNTTVVKPGDGQLVYQVNSSLPASGSPLLNTLTIPKGSRPMQLILTDGTKIWLNASSSVTYPVTFTGNERKVQMTGEAYFEVASLTGTGEKGKMPFIVQKGDVAVNVLGTHFNVNAYEDEDALKVTLLEGSVRVTHNAERKMLEPGQQALVSPSSDQPIQLATPDPDQVMSWKEGFFDFNGEGIQSVMRQLARWYNVEVEYKGEITNNHFSGIISRSNNLSQVLKMLQSTGGVGFSIETGSASLQAGKIIVLHK